MKKLIVLGIVAMMVVSMGVAANAAVWYVAVRSATGGNGTNVQFGNTGNTTGSFSAPAAGTACIALPTAAWTPGNATTLQQKNQATTNTVSTAYKMAVWANSATAPNPVTVKVWLGSPTDINSTMEYGIYAGDVLLKSAFVNTTKTSEANYWFTFTANVPVTTDPAMEAAMWTFKPVVNTPEPGSMLAMLSGMVGLVGYGIRRRK